jgi:hypothetical protein
VQELCLRDYDLTVDARFVGRTFYVHSVLDGLVGRDLGLQQETLKKLEGAMLSSTRVALSTDADINFIVLKARDSRLGVTVTLVRYLPDIKSLIYMRISREDFEERLVLETTNSLDAETPESWYDLSMTEFMARLVASRLQRQFSSNPLINTFLQIRQVQGSFAAGTIRLRLDKFEHDPDTDLLIQEILRTGVEDVVKDVLRKYGARDIVKAVVVKDDTDRSLLELTTKEIFDRAEGGKEMVGERQLGNREKRKEEIKSAA